MNKFLKLMDITFRRDPTNFRPRINKWKSQKDQEQKLAGNYFLMDDSSDKLKKGKKGDAESSDEEFKAPAMKTQQQRDEERKEMKAEKKAAKKAEQKKADAKGQTAEPEKAPKAKKGKKKAADSEEDDWVGEDDAE